MCPASLPIPRCLTNWWFLFDNACNERMREFEKLFGMKYQPTKAISLPTPRLENGHVYLAIISGGAVILLMILAEMKFFGT